MEYIKILIPTDFSVQVEYAYLMVKKLEEKIPVEVHFLHVLEAPDTVSMNGKGEIETCGEIDIEYVLSQKEIVERKLADLKNVYGDQIQTHFVLGKTTDAILEFSEGHEIDLIAMGTKGARGLKETFSGSETQMIVRRSKIPVLSLMCDRSDLNINSILLVNNFNHPVKENLSLLKRLIHVFNIKLHLLQITSGEENIEGASIESNMQEFARLNELSNYECHTINDTDVESGVVHFNQKNNMDLICIGTHGRGGIFHHSATEKLINHLFKPIISFHLSNN